VWVSAGVLSYRPCDREYDCEGCPLYLALKGGAEVAGAPPAVATAAPAAQDPIGKYLAALGSGCTLHLDRAYTAEGLWMAPEPTGDVVVGLDDYTMRLLAPVDGVRVPRVGTWLGQGAPCAWVERGRLAVTLGAPVAGQITEIHPNPPLDVPFSGDHADQRWWFRLRPQHAESAATAAPLLRNEELLTWFLGRVRAVHERLQGAMAADAQVPGLTLADGGIPTFNLEFVLGRERFASLVGTLFPLHS